MPIFGTEHLLNHELGKEAIDILTPTDPAQRGCQLSLFFLKDDALAKGLSSSLSLSL